MDPVQAEAAGEFASMIGSVMVMGVVAVIIIGVMWMRERTRRSAHEVISRALDRGQPLDPELIRELTNDRRFGRRPGGPRSGLRSGVFLLALSGAFVAVGYMRGELASGAFAHSEEAMAAVILGALGAALLVLGVLDLLTRSKDE